MTLHDKLVHALVDYDLKEARKSYHNPNAIALYLEALQSAETFIDQGKDVRTVLVGHFNGRLLTKLLKAAGVAPDTREDQMGGYVRRTEY